MHTHTGSRNNIIQTMTFITHLFIIVTSGCVWRRTDCQRDLRETHKYMQNNQAPVELITPAATMVGTRNLKKRHVDLVLSSSGSSESKTMTLVATFLGAVNTTWKSKANPIANRFRTDIIGFIRRSLNSKMRRSEMTKYRIQTCGL